MAGEELAQLSTGMLIFIIIISVWTIIWKGMALWKAAGNKHKNWFIAMLILNTAGILPIIYIYFFANKTKTKKKKK